MSADAVPFDTARWTLLAGQFRLESVDTSIAGGGRWRAILELKRPDASTRYYPEGYRPWPSRGKVLLQGRVHMAGDSLWKRSELAELEQSTLFVGCRSCTDASPVHYRIRGVAQDGFWGTWVDYQSGIAVRVDATGARLPNPAGLFCAWRVSPGE